MAKQLCRNLQESAQDLRKAGRNEKVRRDFSGR